MQRLRRALNNPHPRRGFHQIQAFCIWKGTSQKPWLANAGDQGRYAEHSEVMPLSTSSSGSRGPRHSDAAEQDEFAQPEPLPHHFTDVSSTHCPQTGTSSHKTRARNSCAALMTALEPPTAARQQTLPLVLPGWGWIPAWKPQAPLSAPLGSCWYAEPVQISRGEIQSSVQEL